MLSGQRNISRACARAAPLVGSSERQPSRTHSACTVASMKNAACTRSAVAMRVRRETPSSSRQSRPLAKREPPIYSHAFPLATSVEAPVAPPAQAAQAPVVISLQTQLLCQRGGARSATSGDPVAPRSLHARPCIFACLTTLLAFCPMADLNQSHAPTKPCSDPKRRTQSGLPLIAKARVRTRCRDEITPRTSR